MIPIPSLTHDLLKADKKRLTTRPFGPCMTLPYFPRVTLSGAPGHLFWQWQKSAPMIGPALPRPCPYLRRGGRRAPEFVRLLSLSLFQHLNMSGRKCARGRGRSLN